MLISSFDYYSNLINFGFKNISSKAAQALTNKFKNMNPEQLSSVQQKISNVAAKREGVKKVFPKLKKETVGDTTVYKQDGNKTYNKILTPSNDVKATRSAINEVGNNIVGGKIPDTATNKYVDSYARNKLSNPSDKTGDAKRYLDDSINRKDATQAGRDALVAENQAALEKRGAKVVNNTIVAKDVPDNLPEAEIAKQANKFQSDAVAPKPIPVELPPDPSTVVAAPSSLTLDLPIPNQPSTPAALSAREATRQRRLQQVQEGRAKQKAAQQNMSNLTLAGAGALGLGAVGAGAYGIGKMIQPKEKMTNYSYMSNVVNFYGCENSDPTWNTIEIAPVKARPGHDYNLKINKTKQRIRYTRTIPNNYDLMVNRYK